MRKSHDRAFAQRHPEPFRPLRRPAPGLGAALERYLRRHLRLAQPQVYLELFATALELHQEREPAALLSQAASATGQEACACPHCGQVNPEQLFEIIEERTVDDQGCDADQRHAPLVAGLMPSRWDYEALVMAQFSGNRLLRPPCWPTAARCDRPTTACSTLPLGPAPERTLPHRDRRLGQSQTPGPAAGGFSIRIEE